MAFRSATAFIAGRIGALQRLNIIMMGFDRSQSWEEGLASWIRWSSLGRKPQIFNSAANELLFATLLPSSTLCYFTFPFMSCYTGALTKGDEKMLFNKAHTKPTIMGSSWSKNNSTSCLSKTSCEATEQRRAPGHYTSGQGRRCLYSDCSNPLEWP